MTDIDKFVNLCHLYYHDGTTVLDI